MCARQAGRVGATKCGHFDIGGLAPGNIRTGCPANIDFAAGEPGQQVLTKAEGLFLLINHQQRVSS